jgi:dTDP-glucose 4,6-dehydratase
MIEGLWRLWLSGEPGPINLGNPVELSVLEFARKILELTGSSSPIQFLPLPQDDPRRRQPDITKARQLLGWEPRVSLEEGLRETIAWFRRLTAVKV